MTDVREIVREYLVAHGYDGLCLGCECGCTIDGLEPCDDGPWDCHPGYKCDVATKALADGEVWICPIRYGSPECKDCVVGLRGGR